MDNFQPWHPLHNPSILPPKVKDGTWWNVLTYFNPQGREILLDKPHRERQDPEKGI